MESVRFNADMLQEPFKQYKLSSSVVITFQVMAVSGVSPGHPDPIRTMTEGSQYKLGAHPCGTRHADNPEIMGILETAHTGQIRRTIAAPVTEESCDLWLQVTHLNLLISRLSEK